MHEPFGTTYRPRVRGCRRCVRCDQPHRSTPKNFPPREDGKLGIYCAKCHAKVTRRRRPRNEVGLATAGGATRLIVYVRSLKERPCTDCGKQYHGSAMQFDHVRGEKRFSLSNVNRRSFQECMEEVAKCDVVCANCHSVRTWNRARRPGTPEAPFRPLNDSPAPSLNAEDTLHP